MMTATRMAKSNSFIFSFSFSLFCCHCMTTMWKFHVLWRTLTQDNDFFLFMNLETVTLEFNSWKYCQHLSMLKKSWKKSDKVENRANNSLLGDVFAAVATVLLLKLPSVHLKEVMAKQIYRYQRLSLWRWKYGKCLNKVVVSQYTLCPQTHVVRFSD